MILLDVNIFMDMLEGWQGIESSAQVINLVRGKKVAGCVSALTIPILWFLAEKTLSESEAKKVAHEIVKGFSIIPLNSGVLNEAFRSEVDDFEDAIQLYSALKSKSDFLITRNKKDYNLQNKRIGVYTPEEFLTKSNIG